MVAYLHDLAKSARICIRAGNTSSKFGSVVSFLLACNQSESVLVLTVVASCKSSEHAEKLSFMYSGDPYSSVSGALCVLLNVVATALIACKAW